MIGGYHGEEQSSDRLMQEARDIGGDQEGSLVTEGEICKLVN